MTIEVRQTDGDKWGVFLEEHLLGESKWRFDADFAKNLLDAAFKDEYNRGCRVGGQIVYTCGYESFGEFLTGRDR